MRPAATQVRITALILCSATSLTHVMAGQSRLRFLVSFFLLSTVHHSSATIVLASSDTDVKSDDFCGANIDCGFESNSICYQGKCICKLGYDWDPTQYRCAKTVCLKDRDCRSFEHTGCDVASRFCVCQSPFVMDSYSQKCVDHSVPASNQSYIFIPIGIVILLVLVAGGGGGGHWCYHRYRHEPSTIEAHVINVNPNAATASTPYPPYPSEMFINNPALYASEAQPQPPPPYSSAVYSVGGESKATK